MYESQDMLSKQFCWQTIMALHLNQNLQERFREEMYIRL